MRDTGIADQIEAGIADQRGNSKKFPAIFPADREFEDGGPFGLPWIA
jgi:hypothetical protein